MAVSPDAVTWGYRLLLGRNPAAVPRGKAIDELAVVTLERTEVLNALNFELLRDLGAALAMHPALLLLDEPTSALDPRRVNSLRMLLRTFVDRGHTMIIISHSMGFLEGVSDNILFMEGGVAVEFGPTDEVLKSPKDARTKDFLLTADSAD